jgi:protein TonB
LKKHRYKVSFSITTLIYISLFLTYLVFVGHTFVVSQKEKDETINLSLSQFIPEVIEQPVVEKEIEPEPEPEEEPVEPEPEPEEPVEEEIIPEPVVKPIPELKPVIKEVKKKPKPKKIVKKKKRRKVKKSSSRRATSHSVNPNKKSQFLAKIRAKINRAKSYPRIAQKRGMQGTVKVRFTILKNGHVGHISLNGPKVFHNSAKRAVKKAFPINTKNAPLSLPTAVNLSLRYQLR